MVDLIHPAQLSLPVQLDDSATLENFYLTQNSDNCLLLGVLEQFSSLPKSEKSGTSALGVYIWGESGSGVSHLLQALCHRADGLGRNCIYLPLKEFIGDEPSEILGDLEHMDVVCIDDIDVLVSSQQWAEQLFHFFNRAVLANCAIVTGARVSAAAIETPLADLQSRLSSLEIYRVQSLSDDDIVQALIFRAKRRGMDMPLIVAQYLLSREERSLNVQFALLDKLDKTSLTEKRLLTIPFVKRVLNL